MMRLIVDEDKQVKRQPYSGPLEVAKRFCDLPEALVAKSILESAGIDCFLADENMARIGGGLYSNLIGGTKLMLRPEDLETATQLLSQMGTEEIELEEETTLEELLRKAPRRNPSGDEGK
jgi:Putative prokaryotic signal transducing protein